VSTVVGGCGGGCAGRRTRSTRTRTHAASLPHLQPTHLRLCGCVSAEQLLGPAGQAGQRLADGHQLGDHGLAVAEAQAQLLGRLLHIARRQAGVAIDKQRDASVGVVCREQDDRARHCSSNGCRSEINTCRLC
jgi:hypothetical protein